MLRFSVVHFSFYFLLSRYKKMESCFSFQTLSSQYRKFNNELYHCQQNLFTSRNIFSNRNKCVSFYLIILYILVLNFNWVIFSLRLFCTLQFIFPSQCFLKKTFQNSNVLVEKAMFLPSIFHRFSNTKVNLCFDILLYSEIWRRISSGNPLGNLQIF